MPKNRQYYRKTKYPDKVAKPKSLVFVRIFLFRSAGSKITYFPTIPFYISPSAFFASSSAISLYLSPECPLTFIKSTSTCFEAFL